MLLNTERHCLGWRMIYNINSILKKLQSFVHQLMENQGKEYKQVHVEQLKL